MTARRGAGGQQLTDLFTGLFDDAALFPPQDARLDDAVRDHLAHRAAWYRDTVATFVCTAGRLLPVAREFERQRAAAPVPVSVVVPSGLDAVPRLLDLTTCLPVVTVAALEVPLGGHRVETAVQLLRGVIEAGIRTSLEIPVRSVTDHQVHELAAAGIALKLRTGGTSIDSFATELELARPLVLCAAERHPLKCTAGLHHAVRHTDRRTMFEHHGFLNIALALRVAAASGNVAATRDMLAMRDPQRVIGLVRALSAADVRAVRALFRSFGTCSITLPLADLVDAQLISAP